MMILKFLLIASVLVATSSAGWVKVWEDNFDGNALNDNNWNYDEGCNWQNNELQCYTSHRRENVRVENGHLVINARVEHWDSHGHSKSYTSGRLTCKHNWTFGRFESRAKLPKGKHLWPAIWMMPAKSVYGGWAASGEIDIMEYRGQSHNEVQGTIHYGGSWPNNIYHGSGEKDFHTDFGNDYHIFAVEWNQNEIKWFVDNNHYHTENLNKMMWSGRGNNPYHKNGQPFDQSFFWILNVAVGGAFFPENRYGHLTENEARHWEKPTMEVDYVRVFEWR